MVVNLEKSFSMKNCSMVKKILKILYTVSRNKLDHSEKKYGLPLWLCIIENKDLIILVFVSFPWHSMKLYQHSDFLQFYLCIYLWPEKWQNHVISFSEITMENDWWLLILRNHSQWNIVQWSRRSWKSCIPVWKKIFITVFFLSFFSLFSFSHFIVCFLLAIVFSVFF
jgi:hypothetical protein